MKRVAARGDARRSWATLLLCALVAALHASACDPRITEDYTISGYVRDLATGEAMRGVRVTFTSDTLYRGSTRTARNGAYELHVRSDVLFGQVRAEHEGYVPDERTVYFDSKERRIDLGLRASP